MIFPFLNGPAAADQTAGMKKTIAREYAWDFNTNEFVLEDGRVRVAEGTEAVKIWIYKALSTPRFRYLAYSWDYGNELESLIGNRNITNSAIDSEMKRYLSEALLANPYILQISNLQVQPDKDRLELDFTVVTDFGSISISI